jgi:hypothetical protein
VIDLTKGKILVTPESESPRTAEILISRKYKRLALPEDISANKRLNQLIASMSENRDKSFAEACQGIEKLRVENAKLKEDWLAFGPNALFYRAARTSA